MKNMQQNAREESGIIKGKNRAVAVISVLRCWGDLVRNQEF